MKKLLLLLTVSIFVLSVASTAMAWTLVYSNDENGNGTYGSLQILVDAVKAGKQVRWGWTGGAQVLGAEMVWVGDNGQIYAQNTSALLPSSDGVVMTIGPNPYRVFYSVSTLGDIHRRYWSLTTNTTGEEAQWKAPMNWYIE